MALVRTEARWRCAGPPTVPPTLCDACGEGPTSDRDAERHTKASNHTTITSIRPKETR